MKILENHFSGSKHYAYEAFCLRQLDRATGVGLPPPPRKACSKKWAELIKLVYEVNPLQCPKCLHEMRIVSIINDPLVVEKILKHLDLWHPQAHGPPMSEVDKIVEETMYDYSFFDYLPS